MHLKEVIIKTTVTEGGVVHEIVDKMGKDEEGYCYYWLAIEKGAYELALWEREEYRKLYYELEEKFHRIKRNKL